LQNIKLIAVCFHQNFRVSEAEFHILLGHKDLALATEPGITISKEPQAAWNLITEKLKLVSGPLSSLDGHTDGFSARFYRFTVKLSYFLRYLSSVA